MALTNKTSVVKIKRVSGHILAAFTNWMHVDVSVSGSCAPSRFKSPCPSAAMSVHNGFTVFLNIAPLIYCYSITAQIICWPKCDACQVSANFVLFLVSTKLSNMTLATLVFG